MRTAGVFLIAVLMVSMTGWLVLPASAQVVGSFAPPSREFREFLDRQVYGIQSVESSEGHPLGLIPEPVDLSHMSALRTPQMQILDTLPSSYDLRSVGNKLTPVGNQGSCGSCWAFATYGSLESCLLPGETWNFSEDHLKNTHLFDFSCCEGGNRYFSAAYLARWDGPVLEADEPYNTNCYSPSGLTVRKHVQDIDFLPNRTGATDNNIIKQAVMTYGAVQTSMYWSDSYYNSSKRAYYYLGGAASNHAVCIVGWNDNYDKSNFLTAPPGNGAFIIRNSWGSSWGENGYFYISYYDSKIGASNAVFRAAEPTSNYDYLYSYDPLGWVGNYGYSSNTGWFANVFTAQRQENIAAASWYVSSPNSTYELRVYLNPSGGPLSPSGPVSVKTGTLATAGYHTVALDAAVPVTAGQKFSVVVKLTTPGYNYPIPVEYAYAGYSSAASASPGQSYVSYNGASWQDATTFDATMNVCLKAFTRTVPQTATPAFEPDGGTFASPIWVMVVCPTPGAVIRYSTDGNDPDESYPAIASGDSVLVSTSCTLKARAWAPGYQPSAVKSAVFTITTLAGIKARPNDADATISGPVVTAVMGNLFYVESDDRSCGIGVYKSGHGMSPGMRASIVGTVRTNTEGEKYINATSVTQTGTGAIEPLVLTNSSLGGADYCYNPLTGAGQQGIKDAIGLNNIGLLVTTTGRVTYSSDGLFYINDGSGLRDYSGNLGVRVSATNLVVPDAGKYVKVTGISTCVKSGENLYRQIKVAQQSDIVILD